MIEIKSFIMERKQVGIIYHFTSFDGFVGMLAGNKLILKSIFYDYISFTRDYDLVTRSGEFESAEVRIAVYGDLLSDKYHIEPFNFYDLHGERGWGQTESEERIHQESVIVPNYMIAHVQFLWEKEDLTEYEPEEWDTFLIDNKIPYYADPKKWLNRVEVQRELKDMSL